MAGTEVGGDVGRGESDLTVVGLCQIAGQAVQVDAEPARRFRIQQLRQARRQARP